MYAVLRAEAAEKTYVTVDDTLPGLWMDPVGSTKLVVWQGDITTLKVGAILNAANEQGLGCFQPSHRCIDNIIHRAAGPSLRLECAEQMSARDQDLSAGTPPIVTGGYNLRCSYIIHVTGPQLPPNTVEPSPHHQRLLALAYTNALDACAKYNITSIALCCVSTGLYGYPSNHAAQVAVDSVKEWLAQHPETTLEYVVFDVFAQADLIAYRQLVNQPQRVRDSSEFSLPSDEAGAAAKWLQEADVVVICAGAGMSVKDDSAEENVYVNPNHFAKHYPFMLPYGYRTAYECMGLLGDRRVPDAVKWSYFAKHFGSVRFQRTPNEGYGKLLSLLDGKEYFVYTSNVDGCFERSGFNPDCIYSPQGDCQYYQCLGKNFEGPCRPDSFFSIREPYEKILSNPKPDGTMQEADVPKCPRCGGKTFTNVRGGDWFLHQPYQAAQDRYVAFCERHLAAGKTLAVLEVGVGYNTPSVTRFPMEALVREWSSKHGKDSACLIRLNPNDNDVPRTLRAVGLAQGWDAFEVFLKSREHSDTVAQAEQRVRARLAEGRGGGNQQGMAPWNFDWRAMLRNLQD
eukprot:c19700_g1_i1.p1 GENE.c19700_g1_i1~~c19700_g1_i1.p1  ORF type:complete len:570 (+),score=105.30 c19700_g1_i1:239-1948(+)